MTYYINTKTGVIFKGDIPVLEGFDCREATEQEIEDSLKQPINIALEQAENNYIDFCRSLGLPDKASTQDFNNYVLALKAQGKEIEAVQVSLQALALINEVTQQGGTWANIDYTNIED